MRSRLEFETCSIRLFVFDDSFRLPEYRPSEAVSQSVFYRCFPAEVRYTVIDAQYEIAEKAQNIWVNI